MPIKSFIKLFYIAMLLLVSINVVQAKSSNTAPFGLSSLQGTYAYYNKGEDVVSLGVWTFDGKGGATLKFKFSRPNTRNGRFVVFVLGTGRYDVDAIGQGVVTLKFKVEDKKEDSKVTLEELISLKDIDLHIKKGEFTCIIGECGSGKSTLLSTIIGDLIYVDPSVVTKYGSSISGMQKRFNSEKDRTQIKELASDLIGGVNKLFKPPIRLNGSLAYA